MRIIVGNNIYAFTHNGILHSYTIIYWPKAKKDGLCMIYRCKKPKEEKKVKFGITVRLPGHVLCKYIVN